MNHQKILLLLCTTTFISFSNISQAQQNLDAHEHGSAIMNLAVDQKKFKIDFVAPGADIVGFEHPASSHTDKEKIEDALKKLNDLSNLLGIGARAECEMIMVSAKLEEEGDGDNHSDHEKHEHEDEHDHEKHEHEDEHDHEKHEHEDKHDHEKHEHEDEHDHEKHEHEDEHDHEKHEHEDEHDHEKHEHEDEHDHEASHSEFHASYEFECKNPSEFSINRVNYFDEFKNSVKLKLRVVSSKGPKSFDLDRENSTVELGDMFF
jgi:hypothetical protein